MLVLRRRKNEAVHIHTTDGIITVTIGNYNKGAVSLGFKAPDKVRIIRDDIKQHHKQPEAFQPMSTQSLHQYLSSRKS